MCSLSPMHIAVNQDLSSDLQTHATEKKNVYTYICVCLVVVIGIHIVHYLLGFISELFFF